MDLPVKPGTALIVSALALLVLAIAAGVGLPGGPELLLVTVVVIPLYILYRVGRWVYGQIAG